MSGDGALGGTDLGVGEELGPRPHVGAAAEQGPALALGHPAPDTELGAVVEGIGEALGDDGAALADRLGGALGLALHEEGVGVGAGTATENGPVRHPLTVCGGSGGGDAHVHLFRTKPQSWVSRLVRRPAQTLLRTPRRGYRPKRSRRWPNG